MATRTIEILREVYTTGDRYGIIRANSRKTREYGIKVGDEVWVQLGSYSTLRGVKFAVACIEAGATREQINYCNADDIATRIANKSKSYKPGTNEKYDADELRREEIEAIIAK